MANRIRTAARGRVKVNFKDTKGRMCIVHESNATIEPSLWLGVSTNRMHLNQQMAAELLPLLQHFVDTGKLQQNAS